MKVGRRELAILACVKIIALVLFSSDHLTKLFAPFVSHYLSNILSNPWDFFYFNNQMVEFPYNPLMLYLLSFFYLPYKLLGSSSPCLQNLLLKLPSFIADFSIFYLLHKSYPNRQKEVMVFYAVSPIIFYAVYMHSQLDLIPTAMLFASVYFLKKKQITTAALLTGAALSTKLHIAAALPLFIAYLLKNTSLKKTVSFCCTSLGISLIIVAPYILSTGFFHMVLQHPKQMMMFESFAQFGSLKIYLPILALLILYGRFFAYPKVNNDLLDAFLAISFSALVLLIPPAPGWYIWMHPFLSALFIKHYKTNKFSALSYAAIACSYTAFFLIFFSSGMQDLFILGSPLFQKITDEKLANISFTLLEGSLLLVIYFLYKFGIRSNSVYSRTQALVVGISGDSGAGKTTFMADLKNILGARATILEGDGDHKWERGDKNWQEYTHLNPKANYLHRQSENIFMLKQGLTTKRINYNHKTGTFDPPQKIKPTDFVIFAGLHPFYLPKMRRLIDLKIFIEPEKKLQHHWKIVRDTLLRGHSLERVLNQIKQRQPDKTKHIEPQKKFADVVISYFTTDSFEIGNPHHKPKINVKVTLDSSITLDPLIKLFIKEEIAIEWDYADDLQRQYIVSSQELSAQQLAQFARKLLVNIEEISAHTIHWQAGHRGFVQLVILLVLSEKMKEQQSTWEKNTDSYSTLTTPSTTTPQHTMHL